MNNVKVLLAILAIAGMQQAAAPQTVSGRSFLTGFELGSLAEGYATGYGGSVQSAIVRSGSYAYRASPIYSNTRIGFTSRSSGGAMRQIFRSSRFYLYVAQLPVAGSVAIVRLGGAATFNPEIDLNADGTLTLADSWHPMLARSQNALGADALWHRVEFDVGYGLRVYVDGVLWASGGTATYPAAASISFGAGESPTFVNATTDLYFDDIMVDGGSFSATGWPGDGHVVLLKAVADPIGLNSWTGGAGGTSNLYLAVNHAPPAGLPVKIQTNTSQIRNGARGGNLDYTPALQSYVAAGVPAAATVNAVMAICNDGQETSKGSAKTGGIWIDSNPSQAVGGYSFDYGDGAGVIASFPAGWVTHAGPVVSRPTVNLALPPAVTVRKSSGSGVNVDFLGLYVEYR